MFDAGAEALLEEAVYEGIQKETIQGAEDLDKLTQTIYRQFSIWPEKHDELKHQWMNVPLMYEDPFYDINYVYGSILALKFYALYTRDPNNFAPKYIALLKNGFDAPPNDLLKRFLDVDLNDPSLVTDAMTILEAKIDLLEKNYQSKSDLQ
jgi:oligoendopeptidase F